MRNPIQWILLPALALAFTACTTKGSEDGGTSGGSSGGTTGGVDSGGAGCAVAGCPATEACDPTSGQCACLVDAGYIPPCGNSCCPPNYSCGTNPTSCICNPPFTYCGVDCINTQSDNQNCGSCKNVCDGGVACVNFACEYPDSGPPDGGPDSGPPDSGPVDGGPDSGLPGFGANCNPTITPDPCATYGLFCDRQTSTCQLPIEYITCKPTIGCASPLHCDTFQLNGGGQGSFCVFHCVDDRGCINIADECVTIQMKTICYSVFCGPGSMIDGGFYEACTMFPSNRPGTCVPIPTSTGALGICTEHGSVAQNQPCSAIRFDAGPDQLCDFNLECIQFTQAVDGGSKSAGSLCAPMCDLAGISATETCASGSTCEPQGGDFGFCLQDCTDGGTACPSPLQCSGFATQPPTNECLPTPPDAG